MPAISVLPLPTRDLAVGFFVAVERLLGALPSVVPRLASDKFPASARASYARQRATKAKTSLGNHGLNGQHAEVYPLVNY